MNFESGTLNPPVSGEPTSDIRHQGRYMAHPAKNYWRQRLEACRQQLESNNFEAFVAETPDQGDPHQCRPRALKQEFHVVPASEDAMPETALQLKRKYTYLKTGHRQFAGKIVVMEVYGWFDTTPIGR